MRYAVLIAVCAAASGCVARYISLQHPEYPDDPVEFFPLGDDWQIDEPLFPGDAELLSDLSVEQTLDYDYQPPSGIRVAVMRLGQEVHFTWERDYLVMHDPFRQRVPELLNESPRIHDASYLPEMLVPEQKSAPRLREAAALHQASLLLVYRSSCSSSYTYRFFIFKIFGVSRAEGTCDVEAMLLDVRTGFVPMTTTVSKPYSVERSSETWNMLIETLAAQWRARREALEEMTGEVMQLLNEED